MAFWLKKFVSFWLMPLPFSLVLLLTGAWLTRRAKTARRGRMLLLTGLTALLFFSNHYTSYWLIRPLETSYPPIPALPEGTPVPADLAACRFIVVLGSGNGYDAGLSDNNLLSAAALGRIVEGVRLARRVPEARLVVSGPGVGGRVTHAVMLARTAVSLGLAPERILQIDQARDTEEESAAVQHLVGRAPVALVTSAWHLPRAVALFRRTGVTSVLPCPAGYTTQADTPFQFEHLLFELGALERSTWAVRERLGIWWLWLQGKT